MILNNSSMIYGLLLSIFLLNGCTTPKPIHKEHLQEGQQYNYFTKGSDKSNFINESKTEMLDIYRENRGKPEPIYPAWQPKDSPGNNSYE